MTIHVYTPGISVMLTRLVNRTSGAHPVASTAAYKTVDITPYLGDGGSIRTVKDINQPCGGFSVSFADRMHPDFADTIYALVEPMDLVEIRATRSPQNYRGQPFPLLMRGFVSSVDRAESMGAEGTPQRSVTISGQDSGKLLQIHHIYFEVAVAEERPYLDTFHLMSSLGISVAALPVNEFMHQLIERVANKKIAEMAAFSGAQLKPFKVLASVPDGVCLPQLAAGMDAVSIWQLAEVYGDRPFCEMWVRDTEDGPEFVFRPPPYRDLYSGAYIMDGAVDPGTIDIDISDVVATTAVRSDSRVANLFWVPPGSSQLDANGFLGVAELQRGGNIIDFDYDDNKPELYGVRKMTAGTNLIPQDSQAPVNMRAKAEQAQASGDLAQWFQARIAQLKAMNRQNSSWEDVGYVLKGSSDLVVGKYLRLTRGSVVSTSYISQVSNSISPLNTWTTSCHCVRSDGFIRRNQSTNSPYIGEGRSGVF